MMINPAQSHPSFVICLRNDEYPASLERRKLYEEIPDDAAAREDLIRIIDESGEDYLFPRELFAPVELSGDVRDALSRAS
jgi:hypothetical protein